MIYTVTLNPSIDYYLYLNDLKRGETNRSKEEYTTFGGKGFNVSKMLKGMNQETQAIGYVAGKTGKLFEELIKESDLNYHLYNLNDGQTRINVKINEGEETEINANGPSLNDSMINGLMYQLSELKPGDVLVVSGGLSNNSEETLYKKILNCVPSDVLTVVDTSGRALLYSLQAKPFLIKPNFKELQSVYARRIISDQDLIEAMKSLQISGARNVIVSLGKQGACMLCENGHIYVARVRQEKVINTVGAGDCLLAGFLTIYLKTRDYKNSFIFSVACASAKAYSKDFPTKAKIKEVLSHTSFIAIR